MIKLKKIIAMGVLLTICIGISSGCDANKGLVIRQDPFYSLQAAYDDGLLNKSNLRSIKTRQSIGDNDSLDELMTDEVKKAFLATFPQGDSTLDDIIVRKYHGDYGDCIALMIGYSTTTYTEALWSETVGGVKIRYTNGQRILVYKKIAD